VEELYTWQLGEEVLFKLFFDAFGAVCVAGIDNKELGGLRLVHEPYYIFKIWRQARCHYNKVITVNPFDQPKKVPAISLADLISLNLAMVDTFRYVIFQDNYVSLILESLVDFG